MSSLEDIIDARIAANKISLDDIPLAALQRALADKLNPDADTFLLPHSVGLDSLADTTGFGPVVTALPSNPIDGQRCIYAADATNGVFWYLRFVPSQPAGKQWVCLGGSPLFAENATQGTVTSVGYAALSSAGPSLTLPLAGDWRVTLGCRSGFNSAANQEIALSYDIGGTAAVDADSIACGHDTASSRKPFNTRTRTQLGLAAATTLTVKGRSSSGTATFDARSLEALPTRVG